MDTLAHGLYGAAIVAHTRDEKKMLVAGLMGMLPDIIPYTVAFIQHGNIYDVNVNLYYATHNVFAAAAAWLISPAYALHVFFDIFTHCGLFATRVFFPLSDVHLCTINYGNEWLLWEINYGVLVGIYYLIYLKFYKPYLRK